MLLLVKGAETASCQASRRALAQVTGNFASRAASTSSKVSPKARANAAQPGKSSKASTSKARLPALEGEAGKHDVDTRIGSIGRTPLGGHPGALAALPRRRFARLAEDAFVLQGQGEEQEEYKPAEVEREQARSEVSVSDPPDLADRVYQRPEHSYGGVHATSYRYQPNYLDEAVQRKDVDSHTSKYADIKEVFPARGYVSMIVDGDQLLFHPFLMNKGIRGARLAVEMIRRFICDDLGVNLPLDRLRIQIFCNLDLFAGYLKGAGLVESKRVLQDFRDELVLLGRFITYATAGDEKDAADVKVKAHLDDHINNPDCQRVYLGGLGDHGYYDDLDFLRLKRNLDKVRLLKFSDNKRDAEFYRNYLHLEAEWSANVFVTTEKLRQDNLLRTDKRGRDKYKKRESRVLMPVPTRVKRSVSRV